MKTLKAYQYRLKPKTNQVTEINQHFGSVRFVKSFSQLFRSRYYKRFGKGVSSRRIQDLLVKKKLLPKWSWLNDVNSQALLSALKDVDTAFTNFFKHGAKYPRFKKKYDSHQSYSAPQHVVVIGNQVKLPKIGLVDFVQHRQLPEGKIKTCTISRNATGKYHISILLEREQNEVIPALVDESQTIAGDLGVLGLHKILMPLVFWVVHHACRFLSKTWLLIHQRLLQPSCLCRGHSLPLDRVRLRQRQWLLAATPLFLFHRFIRPL